MGEISAGCIVVKTYNGIPHVLLVHAAGNWKNKKFGFPKGRVENGEDLKSAAARESKEETGITSDVLDYIGSTKIKKSKKTVHAFMALYQSGPLDGKKATNFQREEVDVAKFYPIDKAIEMVYSYQKPLLEKAKKYIEEEL